MERDSMNLYEFFDHALRELYSLEELFESFGQNQTADVLRSVVEMAYAKLSDIGAVIERDIGQIQVRMNDAGEPLHAEIAVKPAEESLH